MVVILECSLAGATEGNNVLQGVKNKVGSSMKTQECVLMTRWKRSVCNPSVLTIYSVRLVYTLVNRTCSRSDTSQHCWNMLCAVTSVESNGHTHTYRNTKHQYKGHSWCFRSVNASHTQTQLHTDYASSCSWRNITHTHTCHGCRLHSTNICLSLGKDKQAHTGEPEAHTV